MALGKPRDSRKEQQWRRWIHLWQKSGLSVRDFCTRHDLTQPSFYAWRREIQHRDAATVSFVPIQVVPDEQPAPTSRFEVVLAGGRTLRVPPNFDAATLRQLLAVLEEVPPC
jgi:transposase-like protein